MNFTVVVPLYIQPYYVFFCCLIVLLSILEGHPLHFQSIPCPLLLHSQKIPF
uniref:Uncharacterized protein n=1 Tax=Ciona intestinalis TaxID=7719 RepID=H2XJP5_CIOIN